MGYLTTFNIYLIEGDKDEFKTFLKDVEEQSGYDFEDDGYLPDAKWTEHEEDMKAVSLKHPTLLVEVSGRGENDDDIWQQRWRNGEQECHSCYCDPEFTRLTSKNENATVVEKLKAKAKENFHDTIVNMVWRTGEKSYPLLDSFGTGVFVRYDTADPDVKEVVAVRITKDRDDYPPCFKLIFKKGTSLKCSNNPMNYGMDALAAIAKRISDTMFG